jgi:hypothetical protein
MTAPEHPPDGGRATLEARQNLTKIINEYGEMLASGADVERALDAYTTAVRAADGEKLSDYDATVAVLTCGYGLAEMDFTSLADAAQAARDKIARLKGQIGAADGGRPSEPQVIDLMQPVVEMCRGIEALAAAIREVDGDHSLGAGALAEALWKRGYRAVDFGRGRVAAESGNE